MKNTAYSPLKIFRHEDKLSELRQGKQIVPLQVQLIISDLCNHDCSFCAYRMSGYTSNQLFKIVEKDGTENNNPNRMIKYEKVLEILDDCKEMGVKAIQITGGGEPTVHPQHELILKGILDRGLELAVVTNGARMSYSCLQSFARAKWVRVSIDAGTAESYSSIRRISKETFNRVQDNIRALVSQKKQLDTNVRIGIGFVVTKENWGEIYEGAKIASDLGVDNIRISAVFQNEDEKYFDSFYERARELAIKATELNRDDFKVYNNFGNRIADLTQHNPDYSFCGYQQFNTYIGADLNVYRCCNLAYNLRGLTGSLKEQRLKDFWVSESKKEKYSNFDAKGCERCMFNVQNRNIVYAIDPNPDDVNFV